VACTALVEARGVGAHDEEPKEEEGDAGDCDRLGVLFFHEVVQLLERLDAADLEDREVAREVADANEVEVHAGEKQKPGVHVVRADAE